jgi:hypothetical protein
VTPTEAAAELPEAVGKLAKAREAYCTVLQTIGTRTAEALEIGMNEGESVAASERLAAVTVKDFDFDRERKLCDLKIAEDRVEMLRLLAVL